ncbi:hypothetical protein I553_2851 [Mycobacterium xenopi 4042]|uniref:Uncharacterized protein n=1 Tax=Mycobacterium xenopi 4042 TaxID=1299334 RepID=X8ECB4_MYCXE|nr:hypothetical protein I553_2851 [Mycobacterium xenopi 4042]
MWWADRAGRASGGVYAVADPQARIRHPAAGAVVARLVDRGAGAGRGACRRRGDQRNLVEPGHRRAVVVRDLRAAAAIALLGIFSFYLSFVAELPPPPPKPRKAKQPRRRLRRKKRRIADTEAEGAEPGEAEAAPEEPEAEAAEAETAEAAEEPGPPADKPSPRRRNCPAPRTPSQPGTASRIAQSPPDRQVVAAAASALRGGVAVEDK